MGRWRIQHYDVAQRLASGGGGVVFSAFDTRLQRPVVLKRLHRGAARDGALREARLLSAIDHPNVCAVFDVIEAEAEAFLVLPHLSGHTLARLVEEGPLPLPLVLSVGMQIADGLGAAHRLGIVHRDLKPANVLVTEGGLVKILDFGLARRRPAAPLPGLRPSARTGPAGTVAYMAPEQFEGEATPQSDVFALGVVLYEMAAGAHPFRPAGAAPGGLAHAPLARAIQHLEPEPLARRRPDLPSDFEAVVKTCLAKAPAERFASMAEVREALRTLAREAGGEAGEAPAPVAAEGPRRGGILALVSGWLRGPRRTPSLAVAPFQALETDDAAPYFGGALADALAARLSGHPGLVVRAGRPGAEDPATHLLRGTYRRGAGETTLTWQLVEAATDAVAAGGTVAVPSTDLAAVQSRVAEEIQASLVASWRPRPPEAEEPALEGEPAERYLEARALLARFRLRSSAREDLLRAQDLLTGVLLDRPRFAPARSGLGVVFLETARHGYGGGPVELEAAGRSFEEALALDPGLVEADLGRAFVLLARGERAAARAVVRRLRDASPGSLEVRLATAAFLRRDGLVGEALAELTAALAAHPAAAAVVHEQRARLFQYQGRLDRAADELERGLRLEPRHPLLLAALGHLLLRQGETARAVATLEAVTAEAPALRLAWPTLALALVRAGDAVRAHALVTDEVRAAAEVDADMAYRLATFYAAAGDADAALRWLRRSVELGNENRDWLAVNPSWSGLARDPRFLSVLSGLEARRADGARRWAGLTPGGAAGPTASGPAEAGLALPSPAR